MNFEDHYLILDNPPLRSLAWENLRWMFTSTSHATYQPLGWLSWALLWTAVGPAPAAFHAANLLLHAANALLFFFLLNALLRRSNSGDCAAAAAAAALWAVLPIHAESVSWATQLPDLLAVFLGLCAALAYLRGRLPIALAFYFASVLSRWKAIALPAVFLAFDLYPIRHTAADPQASRSSAREILLSKIPFLIIAAMAGTLNFISKTQATPDRAFPFWSNLPLALLFYPWKILNPFPLTVSYEIAGPLSLPMSAAAAASLVVCITLAAVLAWRRWPALLGAWSVYVLLISPVIVERAHDHYAYLPAMSLFAGLSVLWLKAEDALRPVIRAAAGTTLLMVLAFCAAQSWRQAKVWRDSIALWKHVLAAGHAPEWARPNLALALIERDRFEEALAHMEEQVRLFPQNESSRVLLAKMRKDPRRRDGR